jgi:uncharacterized paraquat-inducible protein A
MANKTVSQLETVQDADYLVAGSDNGRASKITISSMADVLWKEMYNHAKAVIVVCSHCKSHNAISNPTCVRCGAPLGDL